MSYRRYRAVGIVNDMKKFVFLQIAFLLMTMCLVSGAFAGTPVGGEVYFYNVKGKQFSVVWEVDTPSTCTVEVYTDIGGTNQIFPTIVSNTDNSSDAQDRGVMQVDVSDLPTGNTTYYIRTVSTGKATGSFTDTSTYYYPDFGSLIPITTEPETVVAPEYVNGTLYVSFYDPAGTINPDDLSQNQLKDIVVIVDAGGDHPVSSTEGSGWPIESEFYAVNVNLTPTLFSGGSYWDWDKTDHDIKIIAIGGQVPGIGKEKRMIDTVYPAAFIDDPDNFPLGGCLSDYSVPNPPDACDSGYNVINMYYLIGNQGPDFNLNPEQTVNKNETLTINICATDPEGDTVTGFSLSDNPSGMSIATDANCATITWKPSVCGTFENIKVTATDDQGGSRTKTFEVEIKRCPPYPPGASIAPAVPVTTQDLVCTAVSNGDPDGDAISFKYAWYNVASPGTILSTTDTLSSSVTVKNNDYACSVIATDTDGDSEPFIAGPVTVQNSPPSAPGSAVVTPDEPKTDQALKCTISESVDVDNDPIQYIYKWSCGTCGEPVVQHGPSGLTEDYLDSNKTARGQSWSCEVWATDGTAESTTPTTSNSVSIANQKPSDPGGIHITPVSNVKTGDDLTCTIDSRSTDEDGDPVQYVFTWNCTGSGCGTPASIERAAKDDPNDVLASTDTAKDQTWSCSVWAQDNFEAKSATIQSANSVEVENSPPEGLTVQVTPDPAYKDDDLTCTASGVTDADGDTISYKYVWKKGETVFVTKDFAAGITTDTVSAGDTGQGETWSCEVTAKDTSDAEVGPVSDQVDVINREPVITIAPAADPQIWDEQQTYTFTVNVTDDDGNEFTLEMDTNYITPDDPNVSDWLSFNPDNNTLTATPQFGSSAIDFGYGGVGRLEFNFIVQETDANPNYTVTKLVTAIIRFPAITVDDFEYDANAPTLADNGWAKLQGSGSFSLKQEDPNDPNSNHYLKTTTTGTNQLDYIIYKNIPTGSVYNNDYPVIQFSVNDNNLYYFDVFVKGKNSADDEANFFMRFMPAEDPNDMVWTSKKSGSYVIVYTGEESIDPNGGVVDIEGNMDTYLFKETGYHYLYLKGLVLRGNIDFIDDIKVRSAPPLGSPKEVASFDAIGNEDEVTLQWTLPENQVENIAGYRIYMDTNDPPAPGKEEALRIATVNPDKTSYTKTGLTNGVTYYFRITAIDNLLIPTETNGVTTSATPEVNPPLAPEDVMASSIDSTIELTWRSPSDQHPDLAGYVIYYCDCADSGDCSACYAASLVTPDKADSEGHFTQYITKDANQEFLQYGTKYNFTVKAKDNAGYFSGGKKASITLSYPSTKVIDNFDIGYESGQTLMSNGWYRLQGKGQFARIGAAGNKYLEVKSNYSGSSALDYNIVKWLKNPSDFTNPNFSALVRSMGNFEIVIYLKGKDGKNYFMSYKGDVTAEDDAATATIVSSRNFVYKLGWMNKQSSTEWYDVERNLDDDLMAATGTGFEMLMGILLKGTMDIDNLELGEGIQDAENVTARPGDSSVTLSWTIPDPNKIDETRIYVDGILDANIVITPTANDYNYEKTGLTNNTSYEFKVVQVAEGDESKGVTITATPMQYTASFTFDDQAAVNEWPLVVTDGVTLNAVYDSGVQSYVMYLNPNSNYPDRYYAANENVNVSDVTGMTCRIKTSSNFVIWVNLQDTSGVPTPFMLGFVPGSTEGNHYSFGNFGYYFLGPDLTDGNWHLLDLKLDDVMDSIFTGVGVDKIIGIYFGGRIYVDDVSIY